MRTRPKFLSAAAVRARSGFKAMFPERSLRHLLGPAAGLRTQTSYRERLLLYDEARACLELGRILEVGSYLGATAAVLATALTRAGADNGCKLYCVDTWKNDAMTEGRWDTRGAFVSNVKKWADVIVPVVGDSKTVELPFEGACDLVFIDADHSYQGCRRDVDRYAPFVRNGGRLVMHDHAYYASVTKVVGELLCHGGWYVARSVENIISLERDKAWGLET